MRRVHLSIDYSRDLHRVKQFAQLPDCIVHEAGGLQSGKVWNEARQRGDASVHGLINDSLRGTSVTVVCIGQRSAHNKYLSYEIDQSLAQGNGLVGITINHLRDQDGTIDAVAPIPPAIQAAGFKVYRYSDKAALVEHIEEAAELAKLDEAERLARKIEDVPAIEPDDRRREPREEIIKGTVHIDGRAYPLKNWNTRGFRATSYYGERAAGDKIDIDFLVSFEGSQLEFSCQTTVMGIYPESGEFVALFIGLDADTRTAINRHFGSRLATG
jgi:hypothetical protein